MISSISNDAFNDLVTMIYSATTRSDITDIVHRMLGLFPNTAAVGSMRDAEHRVQMMWWANLDRSVSERIGREFGTDGTNPFLTSMHSIEAGAFTPVQKIVSPERYRASPLFNEVISPLALQHRSVSCVVRSGGIHAPFGLLESIRHPLNPEDFATIDVLFAHVARSMSIVMRMEELSSNEMQLRDTLDALSFALVRVNKSMAILYANKVAETLLSRSREISVRQGALRAVDETANRRLRKAVQEVIERGCLPSLGRSPDAGQTHRHYIPIGNSMFASVVPGEAFSGLLGEGTAVCKFRILADLSSLAGALISAFELTPSEGEVGAMLINGDTLTDIAEMTNRSIETVRTFVKRILQKTSTTRQAEFVSLAMRAVFD